MRRLLSLALVLLAGCGGATSAPTLPAGASAGPQTTITPVPGATTASSATSLPTTGTGVVIPAACAAGFTDYLKLIEPVVAKFDPKTATLGDFETADDAASEKGLEAMTANGSRATYSCSEVGLEFNYFDTRSPWDAILEIAKAHAPGTVAYLEVNRKVAAIDTAKMSDYDVATCDDAVARIKKAVADQLAAGSETVQDMKIDEGLALSGLYGAYMHDVGDGKCPADVLGNDEFGFMS
jgi:hypothetical protein